MAKKVISGTDLWHNTELGKALSKVLPPEITRVIIDIPLDDPVKIYYASVNTGPILDLKWDEVIERLEVCKPQVHTGPIANLKWDEVFERSDACKPEARNQPSKKIKEYTRIIREKCETGDICHDDIFEACDLIESLETRIRELYKMAQEGIRPL